MTFRAAQGTARGCTIHIEEILFLCGVPSEDGAGELENDTAPPTPNAIDHAPRDVDLTDALAPSPTGWCSDVGSCWSMATSDEAWEATAANEGPTYDLTSSSALALYSTTESCPQRLCHPQMTALSPSDERQPEECLKKSCIARSTRSLASSSVGPTRSASRETPAKINAESTEDGKFPQPDGFCPALLPRCLNTWLSSSTCTSNTASSCFCRSETLVVDVMGCIEAWAQSASERSIAVTCLSGICAKYIPENPAIVTARPTMTDSMPDALGLVCAETEDHIPSSERRCTTVTYRSTTANRTASAVADGNLGTITPLPYTNPNTTLTIPLIYLGTSTVTYAPSTWYESDRQWTLSSSASADSSWPIFSYRPLNISDTVTPTGRATVSGSLGGFKGNTSTQTVRPFASGATRFDIWTLELTLAVVISLTVI